MVMMMISYYDDQVDDDDSDDSDCDDHDHDNDDVGGDGDDGGDLYDDFLAEKCIAWLVLCVQGVWVRLGQTFFGACGESKTLLL